MTGRGLVSDCGVSGSGADIQVGTGGRAGWAGFSAGFRSGLTRLISAQSV